MTKRSKIITIIVSIFVILVIAGLATALGIVASGYKTQDRTLNAMYEKSYYEAIDSMSSIELKLNKASVISGTTLKQELLRDIWRECDIAATNIQQIGTQSDEITKIIKFLNQLGDYSYFLNLKLKSSTLSDEEKDNLEKMYVIIKDVNASFTEMHSKLVGKDEINFTILSKGGLLNETIKAHSSVDYPELIYDGPFSDGLSDRETKFLNNKQDLSKDECKAKVAEYFPEAKNIQYIGEGTAGVMSYMYEFDDNGQSGTVQITKKGGYVLSYNTFCIVDTPTLTEDECVAKGTEYLDRIGYSDMKAVWIYNNDSVVYVNYAYETNEIICYPDLIKVKICSQTGRLLGVEAQTFIYNHTARNITPPVDIVINIASSLTAQSSRLCLIPTEWNTEVLTKEYVATANDLTYYLYYSLETGEEIKVFIEIDDHGKKLV